MIRWRASALTDFVLSAGAYGIVLVGVLTVGAVVFSQQAAARLHDDLTRMAGAVRDLYVARPGYSGLQGEVVAERILPVLARDGACTRAAGDCWPFLPSDGLKLALGPGGSGWSGISAGTARDFVMRVSPSSRDTAAATLDVDVCSRLAAMRLPGLRGVWVDSEPTAIPNRAAATVPALTATTGPSTTDTADTLWTTAALPTPAAADAACVKAQAGGQVSLYLAFR